MSNLDGFTAGALLNAITNAKTEEDNNQVADLFKAIKADPEQGPTEEQREAVNALIGKKVVVAGCIGTVTKLNESSRGFYPGGRYPAYVKLETALSSNRTRAVGCTFEYGLEQIELYYNTPVYRIKGIELKSTENDAIHQLIYTDEDGERTMLVGLNYKDANAGLRDSIKEINDSRLLDVVLKEMDVSFLNEKVYFGFRSLRDLEDITSTLNDLTSLLEYEIKVKGFNNG